MTLFKIIAKRKEIEFSCTETKSRRLFNTGDKLLENTEGLSEEVVRVIKSPESANWCLSVSSWASQVVQWWGICLQCRQLRRLEFDLWVIKIPWRKKCQPLQYSCLKNPMGQRSLVGYSPGGCRVRHDWAWAGTKLVLYLSRELGDRGVICLDYISKEWLSVSRKRHSLFVKAVKAWERLTF